MKDDLETRMKEYESVSKNFLTRRVPVIIRVDGKAFHTFTKGFVKPFDIVLMKTMQDTMKYLCENIQGCVLGYCQSDEITLVLTDYADIGTCAWFDYNVQKICSVVSSMATLEFNKRFGDNYDELYYLYDKGDKNFDKLFERYCAAWHEGAMFDARCFNIPKEEVCNNLIWRQQDATRNSINMVAQFYFSHKELQGVSCDQMQNKLLTEKNVNWNDYTIPQKRGTCCIKIEKKMHDKDGKDFIRKKWELDTKIPIFTKDRKYIEKLI